MSRGDFIVADSQFRLATVGRIILEKLPEQTWQILQKDFKKLEEPDALSDLGMLESYLSMPLCRMYLALSEFVLAFSSFLSDSKNSDAILSKETFEFKNTNGALRKIPKTYFISRIAQHARVDMETAEVVFNTIVDQLKKENVKIECLQCKLVPRDSLRFEYKIEELAEKIRS